MLRREDVSSHEVRACTDDQCMLTCCMIVAVAVRAEASLKGQEGEVMKAYARIFVELGEAYLGFIIQVRLLCNHRSGWCSWLWLPSAIIFSNSYRRLYMADDRDVPNTWA